MNDYTWSEKALSIFENYIDVERAAKMKQYMKGQFEYLGIMATPRRELTRQLFKELGVPSEVSIVIRELFNQPYRELHYVAQEMVQKNKRNWTANTINDIEWLVVTKSWWDTVDFIASNLAGPFFKKFPEQKMEFLEKWNASEDIWLIRTSILFQLKYKKDTDADLLKALILPHITNKEFFIKKAIGWALREYAKTNADWVLDFVRSHKLQGLSEREALKHF